MMRRPKKDDTEEDILEMQKTYMAEKEKSENFKPTVNIINLRKHKADPPSSTETPKQIKSESHSNISPSGNVINAGEVNKDDTVYFPTLLPKIMGQIVEKNTLDATTTANFCPSIKSKQSSSKHPSIFSQRNCKQKDKKIAILPSTSSIKNPSKITSIADGSVILKGEEALHIHNENMVVLQGMTEEEILNERQKLLSTIDPKLVQFVKSLRKQPKSEIKKIPDSSPSKMEVNCDPSSTVDSLIENDIISHPQHNDWMHFDILEKDKLEWMNSFKADGSSQNPENPYEARFSFDGHLLPYVMEYNEENKSLFHHSDEPHRPGYTLNELIQFCRSTVIQQRTLALNTLAGILDFYSLGLYDGVIEIPITKIFFILRFSLDENIPIVLDPALKALNHLLYHKVDEHYLDIILGMNNGLNQPGLVPLYSEMEEKETDLQELKDFHIAELDLIHACIRTDIIQRLCYIMNVMKPEYSSVNYCLQILITLARHSVQNCEKILSTTGFVESIFKNFLPTSLYEKDASKNTGKNKVICSSLKFVRILSSQSRSISKIFIEKFKVLDVLLHYIGKMTIDKMSSMNIQIEAFYLCSVYCNYEIGLSDIMPLVLSLCKTLRDYIENININEAIHNIMYMHATALITLFTNLFANSKINPQNLELGNVVHDCIKNALIKWCIQLSSAEKSSLVQTNLLSAIFNCSNAISRFGFSRSVDDSRLITNCIENMLKSTGFSNICNNLSEYSNLLSSMKLEDDSKKSNLIRLDATLYLGDNKILPVIQESSPITFISAISSFLAFNQFDRQILYLLANSNLSKYLSRIISSKTLSLLDNWFTRIEFNMLYNLLCASTFVTLDENQKDAIYNIAFKLSYILPVSYEDELKSILKNIVFERKWFTIDRIMNNLKINEASHIIDDLESIKKLYIGYIRPDASLKNGITIPHWNRVIMPKDWIYLPILELYSKSQELSLQKLLTHDLIFNNVVNSLKWILIMETCFNDITADIALTDRFCRLICVFLLDNSLFLDPIVKSLLQKCMKVLFDLEKFNSLNFEKPLVGINNFQDLYSQLVDQYQAVSYGDNTFAACVLVPLAQKHNMKWRKLVWSEYAGCLRALDCPEELLCYPLSDYLYPPEKDFSLLKCYHRALNSNLLRPDTVAHKIAVHHLNSIKETQSAK